MFPLNPHNFPGVADAFYHLIYTHSVGLLAYCTWSLVERDKCRDGRSKRKRNLCL